jgi:hypothetical protein
VRQIPIRRNLNLVVQSVSFFKKAALFATMLIGLPLAFAQIQKVQIEPITFTQ